MGDIIKRDERNGDVSPIQRNLLNENREQLYDEEDKAYQALNSIRRIHQGAVQLGLTKLAAQLKDAKDTDEILAIVNKIQEMTNAEDLKNLTMATSKVLGNMRGLYTNVPNIVVIPGGGGGMLKQLFGDL